jgi:hypothetical protein
LPDNHEILELLGYVIQREEWGCDVAVAGAELPDEPIGASPGAFHGQNDIHATIAYGQIGDIGVEEMDIAHVVFLKTSTSLAQHVQRAVHAHNRGVGIAVVLLSSGKFNRKMVLYTLPLDNSSFALARLVCRG